MWQESLRCRHNFCGSDGVLLASNVISGNLSYYGGGGVYFFHSDAILVTNTIISNVVDEWNKYGESGGLHLERSDVTIADNVIADNVAYRKLQFSF
jgi:hypothetical protein